MKRERILEAEEKTDEVKIRVLVVQEAHRGRGPIKGTREKPTKKLKILLKMNTSTRSIIIYRINFAYYAILKKNARFYWGFFELKIFLILAPYLKNTLIESLYSKSVCKKYDYLNNCSYRYSPKSQI